MSAYYGLYRHVKQCVTRSKVIGATEVIGDAGWLVRGVKAVQELPIRCWELRRSVDVGSMAAQMMSEVLES